MEIFYLPSCIAAQISNSFLYQMIQEITTKSSSCWPDRLWIFSFFNFFCETTEKKKLFNLFADWVIVKDIITSIFQSITPEWKRLNLSPLEWSTLWAKKSYRNVLRVKAFFFSWTFCVLFPKAPADNLCVDFFSMLFRSFGCFVVIFFYLRNQRDEWEERVW
jgi:hypothetical protein